MEKDGHRMKESLYQLKSNLSTIEAKIIDNINKKKKGEQSKHK